MRGGSAMAVRVHRARFRRLRRTAHAVFYKSGGTLSPGRGGGLVASSPATKRMLAGVAAVQRSSFQAGGSAYQVPAGRRDGNVSVAGETSGNLPPPTANVNQLNQIFGSKGLTQKQMVALSGAHTIGMAQCSSFDSRLYSFGPNKGQDPSMDPSYLAALTTQCPQSTTPATTLVAMDPVTPNSFDTNYYANVVANRGLLASDQALLADPTTSAQVIGYTNSPGTFQTDFADAMVSMGNIGVLTGSSGTIRTNCRVAT